MVWGTAPALSPETTHEGFSITPFRHDEDDVNWGMVIPAPSKCYHGSVVECTQGPLAANGLPSISPEVPPPILEPAAWRLEFLFCSLEIKCFVRLCIKENYF